MSADPYTREQWLDDLDDYYANHDATLASRDRADDHANSDCPDCHGNGFIGHIPWTSHHGQPEQNPEHEIDVPCPRGCDDPTTTTTAPLQRSGRQDHQEDWS